MLLLTNYTFFGSYTDVFYFYTEEEKGVGVPPPSREGWTTCLYRGLLSDTSYVINDTILCNTLLFPGRTYDFTSSGKSLKFTYRQDFDNENSLTHEHFLCRPVGSFFVY